MPKILAEVVIVRRSELQTQQRTVSPWEANVLRAVNGDMNVEHVRTQEIDGDLPEPESEYARLSTAYGQDTENSGVPFVAQVYGAQGVGISRLAAAMRDAIIEVPAKSAA